MGVHGIKLLVVIVLFGVSVNVYFLSVIINEEFHYKVKPPKKEPDTVNSENVDKINKGLIAEEPDLEINTTRVATTKILDAVKNVKQFYKQLSSFGNQRAQFKTILNDFTKPLQTPLSIENLWNVARKWVGSREIFPVRGSKLLANVLDQLATSKIIKAENSDKGTQLKIMLTLEGGQYALFKPQWYE